MSRPVTVSVVIPCFDDGEFLPDAAESVTRLGRNDVEVIVVDDGSSDARTLRELDALEARGIAVVHQRNKGLAAARNAGIRIARGEFIVPLDSDNRIRPAYLSAGVELLRGAPAAGVVHGDAEYFGGKTGLWKVPEFDLGRLVVGNYIDACALFRKEVWTSIGGYDELMPHMGWEDWDFWLRAAQAGWGFLHLDAVAFDYRVRADSMIAKTARNQQELLAYIFGKRQHRALRLLREQGLELDRLRPIASSRDYRLGRLLLDPVRKGAAFLGVMGPGPGPSRQGDEAGGTAPDAPYSDEWYRLHADEALASARICTEHLWRFVQPDSVVDVGCGRGAWLKACHERGSTLLLGLDGSWNDSRRMIDPAIAFEATELEKGFVVPRRVDLAMSLEVAEHLRPESSETFVRCLTEASDLVLFGAAYPGQGGAHHFNEQPHTYWARLFETLGYAPFDLLRPAVWGDERVAFWYRQNTFLYARTSSAAYAALVAQGISPIANVAFMEAIHPALYRLYQQKAAPRPVGFKSHLRDLVPSFFRGVRGLFQPPPEP